MHELARGDAAGPVLLPQFERDTCVRIAFATTALTRAMLLDKEGAVLATSGATTNGELDVRGPICFHASAAPKLAFDGDAGVVRYIVWGAP